MANNENKIVLIITTKYYPMLNEWEFGADLRNIFEGDENREKLGWADCIEGKSSFKDNPCIKKRTITVDENGYQVVYEVFVVPCLKRDYFRNDTDREKMGKYLEYVIDACSNGSDLNNVYLIAHEKDFIVDTNQVVNDNFVKLEHIHSDTCNLLKKLVEKQHAYMFQHEKTREVGKVVMSINQGGLTERTCDILFRQVFGKTKMNDFFNMVNTDSANEYLFQNNTTPAP